MVKKKEAKAVLVRDAKGRFVKRETAKVEDKQTKKSLSLRDAKGRFMKKEAKEFLEAREKISAKCKCTKGKGCYKAKKKEVADKASPFRAGDVVWFKNPATFGSLDQSDGQSLVWVNDNRDWATDAPCVAAACGRFPFVVESVYEDGKVELVAPFVAMLGLETLRTHQSFLRFVDREEVNFFKPIPIIDAEAGSKAKVEDDSEDTKLEDFIRDITANYALRRLRKREDKRKKRRILVGAATISNSEVLEDVIAELMSETLFR